MPPRPFPFPLRVGTDLCNIPRIRKLVLGKETGNKGKHLEAFLTRILTHPERAYFRSRFGRNEDIYNDVNHVVQFLAGRFAAKEACRKACDHLSKDTRGFKHIVILPVDPISDKTHQSRRPEALVLHKALEDPSKKGPGEEEPFDVHALEGQLCEISISHDGDYASAVAIVPSMKQSQLPPETDRKGPK